MEDNRELPQAIWVKLKDILINENNPRTIKDKKFDKLVKSIQQFPKMIALRPIIVNTGMIILGGNMRYKGCVEAGLSEVPVIIAEDLTEAEQFEFIIKDNVGFGDWDFDVLANEWDEYPLIDWGLDIPNTIPEEPEPEGDQAGKAYKLQVVTSSEEEQDEVYMKLIEIGLRVSKK